MKLRVLYYFNCEELLLRGGEQMDGNVESPATQKIQNLNPT